MKVETILQRKGRDVVTISPDTTVAEAVSVVCKRRIGAVIVVGSDGGVQGIFSERDLIMGINDSGAEILRMPVSDVMTKEVHSCTRQNTVIEVMEMMTRRRIRHVPVIEAGTLIGLVSIGDAVKHRIAETENEAEALRDYIATG